MKKKIFKNTILIILLLVVLCGASIIGVLYNYFNKQYVTSLDQAAISQRVLTLPGWIFSRI